MEVKTKYNVRDKVFVLTDKKIFETYIEKVKVEQSFCCGRIKSDMTIEEWDGLSIQYLIETKATQPPGCKGWMREYDWFDEKDVYTDKESLIAKI